MPEHTTRPLKRRVLIVDDELGNPASAGGRGVHAVAEELRARGIAVVEAVSHEDGIATVVSDAAIHCIFVNWTLGRNDRTSHAGATDLLKAIRGRNAKVPVFLLADRKFAGTITVEVATMADEFVWILEDTAGFIAGRTVAAIERYVAGPAPAIRGSPRPIRTRSGVLMGGSRPPGRRRLPQIAGRAGVLRLLRREPLPHGYGHRAGRFGLAPGPHRTRRRERAIRRTCLRCPPHVLGVDRHLGIEPRDHVRVRG